MECKEKTEKQNGQELHKIPKMVGKENDVPVDKKHCAKEKNKTEEKLMWGKVSNSEVTGSISLVVSVIIGGDIFSSPQIVYKQSASIWMGLIVWMLYGLLAMCRVMCCAKLQPLS